MLSRDRCIFRAYTWSASFSDLWPIAAMTSVGERPPRGRAGGWAVSTSRDRLALTERERKDPYMPLPILSRSTLVTWLEA